MLVTLAAADSASTVRKKYSVFIYSEAEPHAMYAIYKQTRTLCVLQYTVISIIVIVIIIIIIIIIVIIIIILYTFMYNFAQIK